MIKIENERLDEIKENHYNGVRLYINDILQFYINCFEIISGQIKWIPQYYKKDMLWYDHYKTLTSLFSILTNSKCNKESEIDFKLQNVNENIKIECINKGHEIFNFLKELHESTAIIIKGRPKKLVNIYRDLTIRYGDLFDNTNVRDCLDKQFVDEVKLILKRIYNYKKFENGEGFAKSGNWEAYELTKQLGIRVCPYCNRSYTFTITKATEKIVRPELDHFFSQDRYPLFGLSFYNLIPSCSICNARLKQNEQFKLTTHIHPYLNGAGKDIRFNYKPLSVRAFDGDKDYIKISIEKNNRSILIKQIEGNLEIFKIEDTYQEHSDIVAELLVKRKTYTDERIKEIASLFNEKGIVFNKKEIFNQIFGRNKIYYRWQERSLGKFYDDILKQLENEHI